MHKIGVIGDKDSVLCFKAFGLSTYYADINQPEETRKVVDAWANENFGVIFITEQIAESIEETINRYNKAPEMSIIPIPSTQGTNGLSRLRISKNAERAIGMNIFKNS